MRSAPLPPDVGLLLRVLARDPAAENIAIDSSDLPIETIRTAAEQYVVQIMLFSNATAYRTLGVSYDASRDELRAHMGLLLRWLHPDLSDIVEHRTYFERVVQAWALLGSPERRRGDEYRMVKASKRPTAQGRLRQARAPFFATHAIGQLARAHQRRRPGRRWFLLVVFLTMAAGLWTCFER